MRLLANKVNTDFQASSNEAIKISISLAVAYGVLTSVCITIQNEEQIRKENVEKKRDRVLILEVPQ